MSLESLTKPRKLRPGDTIAAVTLSWGGPGAIPERYEIGKRQLEEAFGVRVVEMPHTCASPEYIAANPMARAGDLKLAFEDDDIAGIVSTIGGDDSMRLLPHFDVEVIASHPKAFIGYSDTTVTHLACLKAGLTSFYGPSIMSGFAENGGMHDYLVASVRKALFDSSPIGDLAANSAGWTAETLDWSTPGNNQKARALTPNEPWRLVQGQGPARGRLIGGCLEVLDWLRGTSLWPTVEQWSGAILFLESYRDAPTVEHLVAILRSFAAVGVFDMISGVVFGRVRPAMPTHDLSDREKPEAAIDSAVRQVIATECGLESIPVLANLDFGHTDPMLTLPYGALAEIDSESVAMRILESSVVE